MKRLTAASAMLIAAIGFGTGTVSAAPAAPEAVNFTATTSETATVISTDAGAITVDEGVLRITDGRGNTLAGTELSFRVDDFVFPIAAEIDGRTATLTPQFDREHAVYSPVALPYEDKAPWKSEYEREQAAWSRMTSTISMGAAVGTVVGGLGGAAVGCLLGGVAGATIASATIVGMFGPFVPAAAIGCLGGVLAMGSLGTVAGQLLVTAPVAVMAAVQYFTTINQPFTPPAAK
ncbi:MAG TPA: hypothetical protein VK083_01435 [Nocardia sp.]|uniref:hypothetical protein n=1 Tax=Nocardia TaxID=1817 RepID=UPI002454C938|nr:MULTISPECIES: hypothetical protein [Nocardia]HLS75434.1 hypothetical protein [Nocardia sp.]